MDSNASAESAARGPKPEARGPSAITRLGLALAAPRWALAVADLPAHAGRAGNDLIRAIGILLVAAHTRRLVAAVWVAVVVGLGAGARAVVAVLSQALTIDLAFLVVAALGLWVAAGRRRKLGRAFDLICVAAIPLIAVELIATAIVRAADVEVPAGLGYALTGIAFGWSGAVIGAALRPIRRAPPAEVPVPPEVLRRGRRAGLALVGVAGVALAVNTIWIVRNADLLEPVTPGVVAPAFELPTVGAAGLLGSRVALGSYRGRVVVVDFWATWCKPCVAGLPALGRLGDRATVVLVNLDDPAKARALVDARAPGTTLLYDDRHVAERYGVSALPHTVVVDPTGRVRAVLTGGGDVAAAVAR